MAATRTLLRPLARLAGLHAARQANRFLRAHDRTPDVQQHLLTELLAAHQDTAFGREHAFARIRTPADFASAVPVRTYEQLRPWLDRVHAGESTALLPQGENVLMFSMTSGTTGQPKFIPVTRRFLAAMRMGFNVFGIRLLNDHPQAWLRGIAQLTSSMRECDSPTGIPCGAITGLLAATQKRIVRRMYVVPREVADLGDPLDKAYTALRLAAERDVALFTTANPSTPLRLIEVGRRHVERLARDLRDGTVRPPNGSDAEKLLHHRRRPAPAVARKIEDGLRADGTLYPRHLWTDYVLSNWTGGTLGLYLPRLREVFGDAPIRDIGLIASEGRFSIPLADGTPAGIAEILSNYLEFLPADQRESPNPTTLGAHEVETGGEYFLVVTNWAGLWRYNLDDRVRVTGFRGRTPLIEFLSRGVHTANLTGEKLTEHQVVEALRLAGIDAGVTVERFVMQPCFSDAPGYELHVEDVPAPVLQPLALAADRRLCELNIEYAAKRHSDRLAPVRGVLLERGTLDARETAAIRARRNRAEQYKHRYLLTEVRTAPSS